MKQPIRQLHGANNFKEGDVVRINDGQDLKDSRIARVDEPEASGVYGKIIYPLSEVGLLVFWHMGVIKLVSETEFRPLLEK